MKPAKQNPGFRLKLIHHLIKKNNYKRYLEIGVARGITFNKVQIDHKDGVDPAGKPANYIMTSDKFFKQALSSYNLFFIDGLHEEEQTYRDIMNCLSLMTIGGTILVHDCNPTSEHLQRDEFDDKGSWCGTAWKALARVRRDHNDLVVYTIDTDCGLGIITPGMQTVAHDHPLTYESLAEHREEILGLILAEKFVGS